MSLLQGVLRSNAADLAAVEKKLKSMNILESPRRTSPTSSDRDDSDDDLVNVVSIPGTPDRTRPSSPTQRGASSRPLRGPLFISSRRDPLKAFPTEISQRIFSCLSIPDLARCALVSRKWLKSQTINYVWFRHYRKENFRDESLPPGKWTKRESKQSWRVVHLKSSDERSSKYSSYSTTSGYSTPSRTASGVQTPREIKEEQWKLEEASFKPGKAEMRSMYKELGGRKSKGKTKLGSAGIRDRGGWGGQDW